MAVELDHEYVKTNIDRGVIKGDVAEVGSRYENAQIGNTRHLCESAGLSWSGIDLVPGRDVDHVVDICDATAVAPFAQRWDALLILNVLEHVYDPVSALTNASRLLRPGGACVVVSPTVWPLHRFPVDCWRPLPDFYREWAKRNNAVVEDMTWLSLGRSFPVSSLDVDGVEHLPSKVVADRLFGRTRAQASRALNRLLDLPARQFHFPYVGLGVVITL